MLLLRKGKIDNLKVDPRWPRKSVLIDKEALDAVSKAQSLLPSFLQLVVTRAYEPENVTLKFLRRVGSVMFGIIYPQRTSEIEEIFGHNGHATDGCHVDISIEADGKLLRLLPQSVFTPLASVDKKNKSYQNLLQQVKAALEQCGFTIHRNAVEAMQIHCDYLKTSPLPPGEG